MHQNAVLCGNGLMGRCAIWFHSGKSKMKVTMAVCVFPEQTSGLQANVLTMDKSNFVVLLTHYHTISHFDALKTYSCRKLYEKRRNCL